MSAQLSVKPAAVALLCFSYTATSAASSCAENVSDGRLFSSTDEIFKKQSRDVMADGKGLFNLDYRDYKECI